MIYYNFISKNKNYLRSVRFIKDHVSFDMIFPKRWEIKKEYKDKVDMIENESSDVESKVISFVSEVSEEKINDIENTITKIIKYNIEREEKEKLFRYKVQELKEIFSKQKLDNLKNLKFDVDEISSLLNNTDKSNDEGNRERDGEVEVREGAESEHTEK